MHFTNSYVIVTLIVGEDETDEQVKARTDRVAQGIAQQFGHDVGETRSAYDDGWGRLVGYGSSFVNFEPKED